MENADINYDFFCDFSESEDEYIDNKKHVIQSYNKQIIIENNLFEPIILLEEEIVEIKEIEEIKKTNNDELKQQKQYYKLLLSDYKKFLKKINFHSSGTDTTYDLSTKSRSLDKSKIYNIKGTYTNLYKNIKKIKKDLFFINTNFVNKILVIDGENILKSNKFQQLIKVHLKNTEFNEFFNYWFNGGENGLVQPMTSLNLSINDKIYLIEILIKNYLTKYKCVIFISGKSDSNESSAKIINNDSVIFPILYNKEDLREQDDHLMLYVYYHLSKIKNCEIISGDKFKWFNHFEKYLKNFGLEYNFNDSTINIKTCDAYSNDIIIYKNYKYQVGYFYFPFIQNITEIMNIDINLNENTHEHINILLNYINDEQYELIINCVMKIFINLIEFNMENRLDTIINYSNFIILLISKLIYILKDNFNEIINILDKLSQISKKTVNKLEICELLYSNNVLLNSHIFELSEKNDSDASQQLYKFKKNINKYIFITNLYLILKSMSFLLSSGKPIIKIAKLFSVIMTVYDKINDLIHKLRKISNESSELNKIFLMILSHQIFMKKNGFCKKDY